MSSLAPPLAPLADLHLHLYGCLRSHTLLEQLLRLEPHLALHRYEEAYEDAFGHGPPLREILKRARAGDPAAPAAFDRLFVFGDDDAGNFKRFSAKFDLILVTSVMSWQRTGTPPPGLDLHHATWDEVTRFTSDVVRDFASQGLAYAETRFFLSRDAVSEDWPHLLASMQRGVDHARGLAPHAPLLRLAASLPRADPWPQWERVANLALGEGGEMFTGVDFCFVEEGHPPADKADFFRAVRDHNERHPARALAILYHVGESFTDKSLESAVRWVHEAAALGAHRLGHAIALGIDPDALGPHARHESPRERIDQLRYDLAHADALAGFDVRVDRAACDHEIRRLEAGPRDASVEHVYDAARLAEVRARQDYAMRCVRETGAVIEVCPTSNRRIGGIGDPAHHPVHRFLDAGLRVVVAADDPGIFGTTLADELAWVERAAGLSPDEMHALRQNAWNARSEVLTGREKP
ncbi:MAG: hypothetical protein WCJ30_15470 [Deltaproteobacteria bacterium]